jgi:hypothetical protein
MKKIAGNLQGKLDLKDETISRTISFLDKLDHETLNGQRLIARVGAAILIASN